MKRRYKSQFLIFTKPSFQIFFSLDFLVFYFILFYFILCFERRETYLSLFLIEVGNGNKRSYPQVGKVPIFKPQIGKVIFGQTIGEQSVISPKNYVSNETSDLNSFKMIWSTCTKLWCLFFLHFLSFYFHGRQWLNKLEV